jgi:hypothetical protein
MPPIKGSSHRLCSVHTVLYTEMVLCSLIRPVLVKTEPSHWVVQFDVLTAVAMNVRDVTPHSVVESCQRFGGACVSNSRAEE